MCFQRMSSRAWAPAWWDNGHCSFVLGSCHSSNISNLIAYCVSTEIETFILILRGPHTYLKAPAPRASEAPVLGCEVPGKHSRKHSGRLIPVSPSPTSPRKPSSGASLALSSWTPVSCPTNTPGEMDEREDGKKPSRRRKKEVFSEAAVGPTPIPDQGNASCPDPHRLLLG